MAAQSTQLLDKVTEVIRDAQTEILKAFYPYQQASNLRMRKIEADQSNLDTSLTGRMEVLEHRLFEIEVKLKMHPPAA